MSRSSLFLSFPSAFHHRNIVLPIIGGLFLYVQLLTHLQSKRSTEAAVLNNTSNAQSKGGGGGGSIDFCQFFFREMLGGFSLSKTPFLLFACAIMFALVFISYLVVNRCGMIVSNSITETARFFMLYFALLVGVGSVAWHGVLVR